jgi:hypothetical protein
LPPFTSNDLGVFFINNVVLKLGEPILANHLVLEVDPLSLGYLLKMEEKYCKSIKTKTDPSENDFESVTKSASGNVVKEIVRLALVVA